MRRSTLRKGPTKRNAPKTSIVTVVILDDVAAKEPIKLGSYHGQIELRCAIFVELVSSRSEEVMKRKSKTRKQVASAQARAVRFASDVLDDDDLASNLEDLSLEEYAAKKRWQIHEANYDLSKSINPSIRRIMTNAQLKARVHELEEENEELSTRLDAITDLASGEYSDDVDDEDEEEE